MEYNIQDKTITDLRKDLDNGVVTSEELFNESVDLANKFQADYNAFVTILSKYKMKKKKDTLITGIPYALKDNFSTSGILTTGSSNIMKDYVPVYDATSYKKLRDAGAVLVGKTVLDELAMGGTGTTGHTGVVKNPYDITRQIGGSSAGSAAAVSLGIVPFALGSDTGGSIRQPASYCGIVGMKPTYGRVSRFGLVAFASSLDQIGPMTKNVYDNALLLNAIVGRDEKDLTSSKKEAEDFTRLIGQDVKGMRIAIPDYFMSDIVSDEVKNKILEIKDLLEKNGVTVSFVSVKYLENAVTLYQIIAMGEASSNLARFDGIRYGYSYDKPKDIEDLYLSTRSLGFGDEVKRRIMVGSYLLSGDNAKTYYNKALSIRDDMKKEFLNVFNDYDLIIGPTTTTTAYGLDENLDDPLKSFMDDVLVIPVNMAGLPAINVPVGFDKSHMPIGMHIIGKHFDEATIYKLASFVENKLKLNLTPEEGLNNE